eukprot:gnl/TRDRNA2_/TRDRNA2_196907_c0_seq1.p1 gnl/TRDRNA2_/TRDRNA2_196907_c0~~gnl/TRDRNA2_/TRDRNA2_196907_c0_seq1.p1  ORF type:complete len:246 (-),score=34.28 gnl/TRDRNA2_/TRDRNA2_196907_c0_seq1:103-840(-)
MGNVGCCAVNKAPEERRCCHPSEDDEDFEPAVASFPALSDDAPTFTKENELQDGLPISTVHQRCCAVSTTSHRVLPSHFAPSAAATYHPTSVARSQATQGQGLAQTIVTRTERFPSRPPPIPVRPTTTALSSVATTKTPAELTSPRVAAAPLRGIVATHGEAGEALPATSLESEPTPRDRKQSTSLTTKWWLDDGRSGNSPIDESLSNSKALHFSLDEKDGDLANSPCNMQGAAQPAPLVPVSAG